MLFIENAGQWPEAARFQVWGPPLGAGTTWLAEDAIWLVVGGAEQESGSMGDEEAFSPSPTPPLTPSPQTAIKLTFPGSNPNVRIEPFDPLTTTVSYFIGNDPDQWHPAVPVCSGVRYADLYPGVDLVMGGRDEAWQLEATPDVPVEQVRVQIEGADIAMLNGTALIMAMDSGSLSMTLPFAPFAYKAFGVSHQGKSRRLTVQSFLDAHYPTHPADDPADLLYSTFLGGAESDESYAIATDATDHVYLTGGTWSSNFPITPGAFQTGHNGGNCDAFVARLNATGSGLDYATFLGGSGSDIGYATAVDGTGQRLCNRLYRLHQLSNHSRRLPDWPQWRLRRCLRGQVEHDWQRARLRHFPGWQRWRLWIRHRHRHDGPRYSDGRDRLKQLPDHNGGLRPKPQRRLRRLCGQVERDR